MSPEISSNDFEASLTENSYVFLGILTILALDEGWKPSSALHTTMGALSISANTASHSPQLNFFDLAFSRSSHVWWRQVITTDHVGNSTVCSPNSVWASRGFMNLPLLQISLYLLRPFLWRAAALAMLNPRSVTVFDCSHQKLQHSSSSQLTGRLNKTNGSMAFYAMVTWFHTIDPFFL